MAMRRLLSAQSSMHLAVKRGVPYVNRSGHTERGVSSIASGPGFSTEQYLAPLQGAIQMLQSDERHALLSMLEAGIPQREKHRRRESEGGLDEQQSAGSGLDDVAANKEDSAGKEVTEVTDVASAAAEAEREEQSEPLSKEDEATADRTEQDVASATRQSWRRRRREHEASRELSSGIC